MTNHETDLVGLLRALSRGRWFTLGYMKGRCHMSAQTLRIGLRAAVKHGLIEKEELLTVEGKRMWRFI